MATWGEADDEDVVFENSMLHQHLREVGFSEEDVSAVPTSKSSVLPAADQAVSSFKGSWIPQSSSFGFRNLIQHFNICSWWNLKRNSLNTRHRRMICNLVDQGGVLEDEDAAFLRNYLLMGDTSIEEPTEEASLFAMFVRSLCIGTLVLAYMAQRIMYPVSTSGRFANVWIYDLMVVFIILLGLFPSLVQLGLVSFLKLKSSTVQQQIAFLVSNIQDLQTKLRKCIRLVQELELVSRGFTFVTPLTAVGRLEQAGMQPSQRQAPRLRHAVFHVARISMKNTRDATLHLLLQHPLECEEDGGCGYVAQLCLDEYGPCATLDDGPELSHATDNYTLEALKAMVQLNNIHLSEFLRRLVLGFLLPRQREQEAGSMEDIVGNLSKCLENHSSKLDQAYQLHRSSIFDKNTKCKSAHPKSNSMLGPLYTAVHSLDLHLQSALKRSRRLEDVVDGLYPEDTGGDWSDLGDLQAQLACDLEMVRSELDACQECCEEAANRIEKAHHKPVSSPDGEGHAEEPLQQQAGEPVALFDLGDPIIQDQVFEAYTDPAELGCNDWECEPVMSDEEYQKKKREKQEAVRLLKELKSVISVRKTEMDAREKVAQDRGLQEAQEDRWPLQGEKSSNSATPKKKKVPTATLR